MSLSRLYAGNYNASPSVAYPSCHLQIYFICASRVQRAFYMATGSAPHTLFLVNPAVHQAQRRAAHLLPTFSSAQLNQFYLIQTSRENNCQENSLLATATKLLRPNAASSHAVWYTR